MAAGYRGAFAIHDDTPMLRIWSAYQIRRRYMNPNYSLQDLADRVCLPIGTPTDQPGPEAFVLDDTDSEFSVTGEWGTGPSGEGVYGATYRYCDPGVGEATATWSFTAPESAIYDIYLSFPEDAAHSKHVLVTVEHATGSTRWTIDQQTANQGDWVKIDRRLLSSSSSSSLQIAQSEEGRVVADAIWIRKVPEDQ